MRLANRRPAETYRLTLLAERGEIEGEGKPGHLIHVTIGRDPATLQVRELFFVGRGKSGHGLDALLSELGEKVSRLLQDRDPETGEELFPEAPA